MSNITVQSIPYQLESVNNASFWKQGDEESFVIEAGKRTDWFIDPAGNYIKDDAPRIFFRSTDDCFLLSARIAVDFISAFDAGGLFIRMGTSIWGKLCFEFSQQAKPMVVSVVTRELSDDCISALLDRRDVYLRIAHTPKITAFHYSHDGKFWYLARYFGFRKANTIDVGFLAQSPTGFGCCSHFTDISYTARALNDYRNGE